MLTAQQVGVMFGAFCLGPLPIASGASGC